MVDYMYLQISWNCNRTWQIVPTSRVFCRAAGGQVVKPLGSIARGPGFESRCCQKCWAVMELFVNASGVQKVHKLTQVTTRYSHYILSLFNMDTCNWNALSPAFLQCSGIVVEELLFLVFQPAICLAIRTRMVDTVGDGVTQNRHFG